MRITFKRLIFIAYLFQTFQATAQSKNILVGQKCPDVILEMVSYGDSKAKLSDFKGKLIILDFWNTYCSGCIQGLKKLDSLQKVYKNEIVILPVSDQQKNVLEKFWASNTITKQIKLPTVVNGKALSLLFPHKIVPHIVWIDKNGIVLGITSSQYVNSKNIKGVLNGENFNWLVKSEEKYDFSIPMLSLKSDSINKFPLYSTLVGHIKNAKSSFKINYDTLNLNVRATIINNNIIELYKKTLRETRWYQLNNRYIYSMIDPARFHYTPEQGYIDVWKQKNNYCYETIVPLGTTKATIYENMRSDLNRYLKLNGRIEKRDTSCLILSCINDTLTIKNTDSKAIKYSFKFLLSELNNIKGWPVVVNEASLKCDGLYFTADLFSPANWSDLNSINKALNNYGLRLFRNRREVDFFVLSDH